MISSQRNDGGVSGLATASLSCLSRMITVRPARTRMSTTYVFIWSHSVDASVGTERWPPHNRHKPDSAEEGHTPIQVAYAASAAGRRPGELSGDGVTCQRVPAGLPRCYPLSTRRAACKASSACSGLPIRR